MGQQRYQRTLGGVEGGSRGLVEAGDVGHLGRLAADVVAATRRAQGEALALPFKNVMNPKRLVPKPLG